MALSFLQGRRLPRASKPASLISVEDTGSLPGGDLQSVLEALVLAGGGGSIIVQEEGSDLTERSKLNFVGSAFTAVDDAGNTRTNVTAAALLNAVASLSGAADKLPYLSGATTMALANFAAAARSLLALTAAADRLPYFDSPTTAALVNFTAAGRALLDDVDAAAQRATLGLVIGTNVQAANANLAAIAGQTTIADRLSYWTGSGAAALANFAAAARSLLGVTAAANTMPYFTSTTAADVTTLTSYMRGLLADTSAAAARATLGMGTLVLASGFLPSPPATAYATVDVRPGGSTPAEGFEVWDFDDTTVEYLDLIGTMSRHFVGQALKLRLPWTATSAVAGNVKWQAAFRRFDAAHDVDGSKTYTYQSTTTAVPGTSGYTAYTDIDFTAAQIDGVLAGEQFCLRVRRDTSVGSNATGDAELWVPGIQLVEV